MTRRNARDLSARELTRALQARGFTLSFRNGEPSIATFPPLPHMTGRQGLVLDRVFGIRASRRDKLAVCLRRLDEETEKSERAAAAKAAWDAEFAQPVEPNFTRPGWTP